MDNRKFQCKRCLVRFGYKHHLEVHLKRKIPCHVEENGQDVEASVLLDEVTPKITRTIQCSKCNKYFASKQSMYSHRKHCNTSIKNNKQSESGNLASTIALLQEELANVNNKLNKLMKDQQDKPVQIITKNTYNTQNNIINITLNSWGNESLDHITNEFLTVCAETKHQGMQQLIKSIHFNPDVPENQNTKIVTKKEKLAAKYINDKWEICNVYDLIEEMIKKNSIILQRHVVNHMDGDIDSSTYLRSLTKSGVISNNFYDLRNTLYAMMFENTYILVEVSS
jgi:hypothetical protein